MTVDASAYWSAVVATVPVLALALVIEVRRNASKWTQESRVVRGIGAASALIYAIALVIVFVASLGALSTGANTDGAALVNNLLVLVLLIAVAAPLADVAVRGAGDLWWHLFQKLPWSELSRRARWWRRLSRQMDALLSDLLDALEEAEYSLKLARSQMQAQLQDSVEMRKEAMGDVADILQDALQDPGHRENARLGQRFLELSLQKLEDTSAIENVIARLTEIREEAYDRLVDLSERISGQERAWMEGINQSTRQELDRQAEALRAAQQEWSRP